MGYTEYTWIAGNFASVTKYMYTCFVCAETVVAECGPPSANFSGIVGDGKFVEQ